MREIKRIILHCSASDIQNQSAAMIDNWHKARGFKSPSGIHIGYHYFIRKDGTLESGRPTEEVGAHCEGYNRDSLGICLAGLKTFSENQFKSLAALLQALKNVWPNATVHGHKEFNKGKECPVYDVAPFKALYESKDR